MAEISAADVSKLRRMTGAGMMDCKKALQESGGDFEKAIEIIRKKGQAVATRRADREATEGVILAKANPDARKGVLIALNCETDFVAKNNDFIGFANRILEVALKEMPASLETLKELPLNGTKIADALTEQIGIIGEKIDLSYYTLLESAQVIAYIHPGNKLATLVGLNQEVAEAQVGKDIAMQVAAMDPVSVDRDNVPQNVIDKEIEIGKEQARQEGKPEELLEKIALGKLNKFFKESTLLNQDFIKDNKTTVGQYLKGIIPNLTVTGFRRYSLRD